MISSNISLTKYHDAHSLGGDTGVGVDLLHHLVDVDGIRLLAQKGIFMITLGLSPYLAFELNLFFRLFFGLEKDPDFFFNCLLEYRPSFNPGQLRGLKACFQSWWRHRCWMGPF